MPAAWFADRPGDVVGLGGQPVGQGFGTSGPDQGYALKLAHRWEDKVVLAPDESRDDVIAGALGVALRRAALFGRAPVTYDLELALAVWGYLTNAGTDLVTFRRRLFEGCAHQYPAQREIADRVPAKTLAMKPAEVRSVIGAGGWRDLLQAD